MIWDFWLKIRIDTGVRPGKQQHQSYHVNCVHMFNECFHWLKLELPSVKYSYVYTFIWISLLPHKCVTQRQDPHMGKCLDIQFYDIFLMGSSCFQTLAVRVVTGARSQFTGNYPSCWPNYHVFCLDSLVVTSSVHVNSAEDEESTSLFAVDI